MVFCVKIMQIFGRCLENFIYVCWLERYRDCKLEFFEVCFKWIYSNISCGEIFYALLQNIVTSFAWIYIIVQVEILEPDRNWISFLPINSESTLMCVINNDRVLIGEKVEVKVHFAILLK